MNAFSKISRLFDNFSNILFYISAALIFVCWLIISFEVFMRELLGLPQTWVVECSEYIILFVTFLGVAWVMKKDGHISIEIVISAFGPKKAALLNFATSILGLFVCLIICIFGILSVIRAYNHHLLTFTALELPKWPFLSVIPLGALMLCLQFVSRARRFWNEMSGNRS